MPQQSQAGAGGTTARGTWAFLEPSHIPGTGGGRTEGQGLTGAFLLALPSAATDTERAMSLAGEALPGRRDTGTGSPVRTRSATSELCTEQQLRVLFMLEQEKGALEAEGRERGRHGAGTPANIGTRSWNCFPTGQNTLLPIATW